MKWLMILMCVILLAGCAAEADVPAAPTETEPTVSVEEIPETQMPEIISQEMAMLEGYVVLEEGDVRHNAGSWVKFLEACEAGQTACVTLVWFEQGEAGYTHVRYDLIFDGSSYAVGYEKDGMSFQAFADELVYASGKLEAGMEPYDSFESWSLHDVVLYQDLIAEPDFEGVQEIFLHSKEGEPPVRAYSGDALQPILELLWNAEYVPCEPENYVYGMKLLMTNRDGKELVIELELNRGYYRYGMQNYRYGDVADLFAALGMEGWPESVLNEYAAYLK